MTLTGRYHVSKQSGDFTTLCPLEKSSVHTEVTLLSPRFIHTNSFDTLSHSGAFLIFGEFIFTQGNHDNRLSMIFADSYAIKSSLMFMMCYALQPEWFAACNPNNQAPILTIVIINQHVQIM